MRAGTRNAALRYVPANERVMSDYELLSICKCPILLLPRWSSSNQMSRFHFFVMLKSLLKERIHLWIELGSLAVHLVEEKLHRADFFPKRISTSFLVLLQAWHIGIQFGCVPRLMFFPPVQRGTTCSTVTLSCRPSEECFIRTKQVGHACPTPLVRMSLSQGPVLE